MVRVSRRRRIDYEYELELGNVSNLFVFLAITDELARRHGGGSSWD
jgi:hypothetical protein